MKLNDVLAITDRVGYAEYNIQAEDVRTHLGALNSLSWRLLIETLEDAPPWLDAPSSAPFIANREDREVWVRSYEVAALACVSFINGLQDHGRIRDLIRVVQDELIEDRAPAKSALFMQGLAYYKLGNHNLAKQRFALGNSEYILSGTVSPLFAYSRTVLCGASRRHLDLGRAARSFGKEEITFETRSDSLLFTSGNPAYILKYFPNYVRSLVDREAMSHADVHLHVMSDPGVPLDLSSGALGDVLAESRRLLGPGFSVSSSLSPAFADMRSYFACKRFLMLDDMLASYDSVVVSDIDFEVVAPVEDFLSWFSDYDFAFRIASDRGTQSWAPWLRTMAGTVAIRDSQSGRSMIERFRELFIDNYFGRNFNWGIDQNILTQILDEYSSVASIGNTRLKNLFMTPAIKRQG